MIATAPRAHPCTCGAVHYDGTGEGPYCTHCGGLKGVVVIPATPRSSKALDLEPARLGTDRRRERGYEMRRAQRLAARAEGKRNR